MITLTDALTSGRGVERPINCPNPDHEDAHASASVNTVIGWWYCYACKARGTVEGFIPKPEDALKALEESLRPVRTYPETWLDLFDAAGTSPYWESRYGRKTASMFRCGTDMMDATPTYPMRDKFGRILGVVKRTDDSRKYIYPYRSRASTTLFSSFAHGYPKVVVLVEGASDVMALHQADLPKTWRVFGTYGAGLHAPQTEIIANLAPRVIVAAFDADDAGRSAIDQALLACSEFALALSLPWDTMGVKDPGELPADQRLEPIRATLRDAGYTE